MALAELAGGDRAQVFAGDTQFFFAVGAPGVERGRDMAAGFVRELDCGLTEVAADLFAQILFVDPEFFTAVGALEVETDWKGVYADGEFLERVKSRDLDGVVFEVFIQQLTTGLAVNEVRRHVLPTAWTGAAGPSGHGQSFFFKSIIRVTDRFEMARYLVWRVCQKEMERASREHGSPSYRCN